MAKGNNSHKKEVKKPKKPKSPPTRWGSCRRAPNLLAFADLITPGPESALFEMTKLIAGYVR